MRFTRLGNRLIGASAAFLLLCTGQAVAQDLSLFEPLDNADTANNPVMRPGAYASASITEPEFTLVGSSRIGNKVKTTLRTRSGELLVVTGAPDSTMPIPGYGGYLLDNSQTRKVSVTLPASVDCVEFADRGVSCENQNTASLSLATAAPVIVVDRNRNNQSDESNAAEGAVSENGTAAQDASNPFAAALRAAANNEVPEDVVNRRADSQRFQMRRIDPADVPEGMRLVRTPFGDRLVQQ